LYVSALLSRKSALRSITTQPAWINGEAGQALNYQAPLSEGIHDSRFGMVGLHMLQYHVTSTPAVAEAPSAEPTATAR